MLSDESAEDPAVTTLREYLRIPTVHPNINYDKCVEFLRDYAERMNLPVRVTKLLSGRPVVVMTLPGTDPSLQSILLNSHMDVVGVVKDEWRYDPFGAYKDAEGNIYARGSQDMKSVGVMFVEAVSRIKAQGHHLRRTVHISFVPDEEVPNPGMGEWVKTDDFKNLNVGCSLDESFASPFKQFFIFGGERSRWTFKIRCRGIGGHSSSIPENTAAEKLRKVMNTLLAFREEEKKKLLDMKLPVADLGLGHVTTLNMTLVQGGIQAGVIPHEMEATFDARLPPNVDPAKFESFLLETCKEAGDDIQLEFLTKEPKWPSTKTDDTNPFWRSLKSACDSMKIDTAVMFCPGGTDARFVRTTGASAFGFTALNETPTLLHNSNEHVNEAQFLKGINIYFYVILALANT